MRRLESDAVRRWLELPDGVPQRYPDVSELTADWIDRGYRPTELAVLSRQAWQGVPGLRTGAKKRLAVPSRSHAEGFNRGQSHLSGESDGED